MGAEDLPPLCFFHTLRSFHTALFYQKEAINLHCRCPENEKKVVPEMFISTRGTLVAGNFNGYQTLALRRRQITLTCPLRSTSELCLKAAGADTCRCFMDKKKLLSLLYQVSRVPCRKADFCFLWLGSTAGTLLLGLVGSPGTANPN